MTLAFSSSHHEMLVQVAALLDKIASERQDHWADRTEKWQESDRGCQHEELTGQVQDLLEQVEELAETEVEGS